MKNIIYWIRVSYRKKEKVNGNKFTIQHTSRLSVLDGTVDVRVTIHSSRLHLSNKKLSTSSEETGDSISSVSAMFLVIVVAHGGFGTGISCWSGSIVRKRDSRICTT